MKAPRVSVVVGVYNKERHVEECLRSVLSQTCGDFELIVVDDRSTDGSLGVIQRFSDPRIRLVRREVNSGLPAIPRNQAVRMARGEYLAFLDADDVWLPDKLEKQVAFMDAHPEFLLTHTRCMVVDDGGQELYLRSHGKYPPDGDCFADLMRKSFICTSTAMLRRKWASRIGGFSEEKQFRCGEDWEFFLRCAKAAPVGMPAGTLAKYRWSPDSTYHHPDSWNSVSCRVFLGRPDLWKGKLDESAVRGMAFDEAEESAYAWRKRADFRRAAWFAGQMIRLAPWRANGWRQLAAALARRS